VSVAVEVAVAVAVEVSADVAVADDAAGAPGGGSVGAGAGVSYGTGAAAFFVASSLAPVDFAGAAAGLCFFAAAAFAAGLAATAGIAAEDTDRTKATVNQRDERERVNLMVRLSKAKPRDPSSKAFSPAPQAQVSHLEDRIGPNLEC
jgi:hypothetical protein